MNFCTEKIEYDKLKDVTTEILFKVASARAAGNNVIRFDIDSKSAKPLNALVRVLRGMKKRGAIQLFITQDGFKSGSTEAQYILNVHPELSCELPTFDDGAFVVVKL